MVLAAAVFAGRLFLRPYLPYGNHAGPIANPTGSEKKAIGQEQYLRSYTAVPLMEVSRLGIRSRLLHWAGVSILYVGSPLSLATRFYGLVAHPLLLLLAGDSGLDFPSVLTARLGSRPT